MKILIIGGTGVLSSAVTQEALRNGIAVTMVNRGNRAIPDGVDHIKADKDDLQRIANALEGKKFDAVMDYLCFTDEQTVKSFNFYSNYTSQYFFISSCAVYDTTQSQLCNEDSPKVLSIWKYSVDKWASEQNLKRLASESCTKVTIIRPGVTYGDTRIPYGISPSYGYHWTLAARILAGKPIIRWNGGINRCNMTRVEDFAVGVVGLIGNSKAYGEAFNICGEDAPSFNDVLDAMSEYLHKEVITVDVTSEFYAKELPSRAGEILGGRSINAINSNLKLKVAVPSFKQTIYLKEGLAKTLEAYKVQNYQKGIDWEFDADSDRIIKKWCKTNHIATDNYHLHFIDYIGTASPSNRRVYWLTYHQDNLIVKSYLFVNRVINKIKRIVF